MMKIWKHPGMFRFLCLVVVLTLAACNSPAGGGPAATNLPGGQSEQNKGVPATAIMEMMPTGETSTADVIAATASVSSAALVYPEFPLTGVEIYEITSAQGLNQVLRMGAYWLRRSSVYWNEIEPEEGQRDWTKLSGLEEELKRAAEKQLQVILVVRGTPTWAQETPGSLCGPVLPGKMAAFASFVGELTMRYSVAPYNVKYWELGNEPDVDAALVPLDSVFGCWGKTGDPYYGGGYYAEMLKQAYPQIKAADPEAQVLVGGLLLDCDPENPPDGKDCTPARYLQGIFENGGGDYFDGVSFHAYDHYAGPYQYSNPNWRSRWDTTGPVLIAKTHFLRAVLQMYGHPEKFLVNTEAGLLCGRSGEEVECQTQEFQLTKAYYVAQSNASAAAEGLRGNLWYSLFGWRGTALLNGQEVLPAYEAFRFSSKMINGAAFVRVVDEFPGVRGYEFLLDERHVWILWSLDGAEHAIQLPQMPGEVFDVFGVPLEPAQELKILPAPVYLRF